VAVSAYKISQKIFLIEKNDQAARRNGRSGRFVIYYNSGRLLKAFSATEKTLDGVKSSFLRG